MNLDVIWLFATSASLLIFIAIAGFIALKFGIFSFKVIMNAVIAARGIENIEGPIESTGHTVSDEKKDIISMFIDDINNFRKTKIGKNYTRYAYMQLFKK